jgi:hypothetical protein
MSFVRLDETVRVDGKNVPERTMTPAGSRIKVASGMPVYRRPDKPPLGRWIHPERKESI